MNFDEIKLEQQDPEIKQEVQEESYKFSPNKEEPKVNFVDRYLLTYSDRKNCSIENWLF